MISKAEGSFLLRRIHSLTGIVPIGGFLLFHFFENASAKRGPEAFNKTVEKISEMPYLFAMEMGLLLLPIIFHSVYGLFITASSKPNLVNNSYSRNWAYFMQRLTGIIGFGYLTYHILSTRVWALLVKGSHITFADMQMKLSDPMIFAVYMVGIAAITFHFANGIWSFSITWGLVKTAEGQKRLSYLTMGLFAVLCVIGWDIVSAFVYKQSFLTQLGL